MTDGQANGFGRWAIGLHWLVAGLIFGLTALGFVMRRIALDPVLQFWLYQWHKSIGLTALGFAGLQALLWLAARHPGPVPGLGPIERRAAQAVHAMLALLALAVPVTGWAVASTTVLNIPTFFFNLVVIPPLPLSRNDAAESFWTVVHAGAAYLLLALAVLHAAAALYHHFVRRDAVLRRMLGRAPAPDTGGRRDER